ncbi:MAG: hypothetical protein QXH75_06925 [Sulfolobaceae archaeon]
MSLEESPLKPGERERNEIVGYINLFLDSLNDFMVKHSTELKNIGVSNKLAVLTGIITMHKYNPEVYINSYWEELVNTLKSIRNQLNVSKELEEMDNLISKINELRERVKF